MTYLKQIEKIMKKNFNVYSIALDWTPNVNHIGFIVGKEKGFYKELGIDLVIQSPAEDDYKYSPAKKIELGISDFGLCPTESLISFRTKKNPFKLYALATIFKKDISAIAVSDKKNIKRPSDLDDKSYASYGARYEDLIVKQLIKNDGGIGNIKIHYPKRLGVWNTIKENKYDSTWIFMNWEGIEVPNLRLFKLKDYNIPYSYSPLIVASSKLINDKKDDVLSFLKATKKAYLYAINNIDESAKLLFKYLPEADKQIDLKKALNFSIDYFGSPENFGKIETGVLARFLKWLNSNQLEKKTFNVNDLYIELDF